MIRRFAKLSVTVRVLALVLGMLLPCLAEAAAFRFAWLSDTHVGSHTAADDLRATVRDINSMTGLSFVVISGDITEYGSREQFALAKSILEELRIPYHIVPGNHDTKWSESGATDFPRLWKADRFVFEHEGYCFVGLHQGPLMKMGDGHWAPQDVRWLEQTLKGMKKGQPIIFVTHYPIDDGIANWFVVLDLLKRYNVQVVLCGHGHGNRKMTFEGVPGIMGRSNLRAKNPVGGFNLVEVNEGVMTCAERTPGVETKAPWHTVRLERHNYGTNGYPRPDFSVNAKDPGVRVRWQERTGYTICGTPGIWENLAIVGDASGLVSAYALDSGKRRWTFKTRNAVYTTPAVSEKVVVVPSTDGVVYGLDPARGKLLWKQRTERPIVASPVIEGGRVYVGSSEGKFRCLDLRTGKAIWEFKDVDGFVETRPLLYEGRVIFGAWGQHLYALEAECGALAWKWKGDKAGDLLSPAACWPVGADNKVFIVAPDRKMTAIDVHTGEQVWRTGDYVVRESIGISEDKKRIYVRAMNDFFFALATDGTTPQKVWECDAQFGYDINSGMLVEKKGTVFYGTKNGVLFALDAQTGKIQWQHKLGTGVMNTVAPLSGRAVVATDFDGTIAVIEKVTK